MDEEISRDMWHKRSFVQCTQIAPLASIRAGTGSLKLAKTVRRAVAKVDANQPVVDIKTMDQRVMDSVSVRRLGLLPVLIFAVINAVTSDEASMDL